MKAPLPHIVHLIPTLNVGGAENSLIAVTRALHDRGFKFSVVCLLSEGLQAERLTSLGIEVHSLEMQRRGIRPGGSFQLWDQLTRLRPDILQTWMYHADLMGGLVANFAGHPRVVWNLRHSELDRETTSGRTRLIASLCAMLSATVPSTIVCGSHAACGTHARLGYDPGRMIVIPNGIDTRTFAPSPRLRSQFRRELDISDDSPAIGVVARWHPDKGHEGFLRAAAVLSQSVDEAMFILCGADMTEDNGALMALINDSGLRNRIRLLGQRSDVPGLLNALDLLCSPSITEGFPNAVAEAMSTGVPVASTDAGDAARIIGDTGWVVPIQDYRSLAGSMRQACAEMKTSLWTARRGAARNRIENLFSADAACDAYADLYRSLA